VCGSSASWVAHQLSEGSCSFRASLSLPLHQQECLCGVSAPMVGTRGVKLYEQAQVPKTDQD
jgi:hypothetical protein